MRALPADQYRLLDLQSLDVAIDRLVARRAALPELEVIATATAAAQEHDHATQLARSTAADEGRAQIKLETEVDQVRSRAARDQQRLDSGAVASARDLESLQSEITSLSRRQTALEEDLLEVMQRREDAQGVANAQQQLADSARARVADAQASLARAQAGIDAEVAALRAQRDSLAPTLPPDLISLYERIRTDRRGVGAAALRRHRCEGCHLELSGADLAAAKAAAPEEVLRCEECRRILVRVPESGL